MTNNPLSSWDHLKVLILAVDRNFVAKMVANIFLRPIRVYLDVRLLSHLNYSRCVESGNHAEKIKSSRKMEYERNIAGDSQTYKKRLVAIARSNACHLNKLFMVRLADDTPTTTPPLVAQCFATYFASTY